MSLSRIILSGAVLAVAGAAALATAEAQVTGPGPLERRANRDTRENLVPRRTRFVLPQNSPPRYSPLIVELRVTLDERGRVGEVRPLGTARETYSFYIPKALGGEVLAFTPVMDGRPPAPDYQAYVTSAMDAVRQWQYDAPANGPIAFDVKFGFPFSGSSNEVLVLWDGLTVASTAPRGGPTKVKDVAPVYPPIAQSARVQGTVMIEAQVEPDGHVSNARALRSIPLLDQAAVDAVMQWEFTPTLVNGARVPFVVITNLQFTLMF
jgi:TonB family protein